MKKSPEQNREANKKYYYKNQKAMILRAQKYYNENKPKVLKRLKEYRLSHLEYFKKRNAERREKIRFLVLTHYGGNPPKCECCEEKIFKFLTIDHIKGGGNKQLRKLGSSLALYLWIIKNNFPQGFQVLCFNCNLGRSKNKGICPHKERIENSKET